MKHTIRILPLVAIALILTGVGVRRAYGSGQSTAQPATKQRSQPTPPYHKSAEESKPLPRLLPASNFSDRPLVARAYQIANEIPLVLAQQPCYCHCDKAFGHTSLLDCFASSHTAGCGICMAETFFAFQMTKQGKTPAEIRDAIVRGDFRRGGVNSNSK